MWHRKLILKLGHNAILIIYLSACRVLTQNRMCSAFSLPLTAVAISRNGSTHSHHTQSHHHHHHHMKMEKYAFFLSSVSTIQFHPLIFNALWKWPEYWTHPFPYELCSHSLWLWESYFSILLLFTARLSTCIVQHEAPQRYGDTRRQLNSAYNSNAENSNSSNDNAMAKCDLIKQKKKINKSEAYLTYLHVIIS